MIVPTRRTAGRKLVGVMQTDLVPADRRRGRSELQSVQHSATILTSRRFRVMLRASQGRLIMPVGLRPRKGRMRLKVALWIATTAVVVAGGPQKIPSAALSGVIAALLADGRISLMDVATGQQLTEYVASPQ